MPRQRSETPCRWCRKPCGPNRVDNPILGAFCSRTCERNKQEDNFAYYPTNDFAARMGREQGEW